MAGALRSVRAVWAVRAAGVGHGLEPVKTLLFMAGALRCGGGGEGGVGGGVGGEGGEGGGVGMDWSP